MLIRNILIASLFCAPTLGVIAGCGGGDTVDADPFPTMQACFDEHHMTEGLSVNDAIVTCCLDHPLGPDGTHPSCKNTAADCMTYLTSDSIGMLSTASATPDQVTAACTDYITMKGM